MDFVFSPKHSCGATPHREKLHFMRCSSCFSDDTFLCCGEQLCASGIFDSCYTQSNLNAFQNSFFQYNLFLLFHLYTLCTTDMHTRRNALRKALTPTFSPLLVELGESEEVAHIHRRNYQQEQQKKKSRQAVFIFPNRQPCSSAPWCGGRWRPHLFS